MINRVILVGNLCRAPELSRSTRGLAITRLRLATNSSWRDDQCHRMDDVQYHSAVAFGLLPEVCADILDSGRQVYLEGRLQTREWDAQDGLRRTTTEILVERLRALGPRPGPRPGGGVPDPPGEAGGGPG